MFRAHVLIIRRSKFYFTASGIITSVGGRPVHGQSHYVTHDAHHSQTHSQQRTLTQRDVLPQHPVNIVQLFCENVFKMTLARNNVAP